MLSSGNSIEKAFSRFGNPSVTLPHTIEMRRGMTGLRTWEGEAGETALRPGMCAGFKAGEGGGHHQVLRAGDRLLADLDLPRGRGVERPADPVRPQERVRRASGAEVFRDEARPAGPSRSQVDEHGRAPAGAGVMRPTKATRNAGPPAAEDRAAVGGSPTGRSLPTVGAVAGHLLRLLLGTNGPRSRWNLAAGRLLDDVEGGGLGGDHHEGEAAGLGVLERLADLGRIVLQGDQLLPEEGQELAAQRQDLADQVKGSASRERVELFARNLTDSLAKEGKLKIHQDAINRMAATYSGSQE